ncbi:MAG: hypothetical protein J6J19_04635 [Oscillospiraceae bacterium]|nr:hypothetical protein [Oscillospiraceae bacterium]
MSKYQPLWEHIQTINADKLSLSYGEIESILGFPIDHSFLTYKKELPAYGWNVKKISMKEQTVLFERRLDHA